MSEKIKGGKSDNLTPKDLAQKHGISVLDIEKEIEIGMGIESEHTPDKDKQKEIAMDHISEFPDYYSNKRYGLISTEKKLSKEENIRQIINNFANKINNMIDDKIEINMSFFHFKLFNFYYLYFNF